MRSALSRWSSVRLAWACVSSVCTRWRASDSRVRWPARPSQVMKAPMRAPVQTRRMVSVMDCFLPRMEDADGVSHPARHGILDGHAFICLQGRAQFGIASAKDDLPRAFLAVTHVRIGAVLQGLPLLMAAEGEPAVADQGLFRRLGNGVGRSWLAQCSLPLVDCRSSGGRGMGWSLFQVVMTP